MSEPTPKSGQIDPKAEHLKLKAEMLADPKNFEEIRCDFCGALIAYASGWLECPVFICSACCPTKSA